MTAMKIPHLQWVIAVLLCLATAVNYLDRQALGIVSVDIRTSSDLDERDYSYILTFFFFAYADHVRGLGLYAGPVGHAPRIRGVHLRMVARADAARLRAGQMVAGQLPVSARLAEPGAWPAAAKAVNEWFPATQRALAMGIFNAGIVARFGCWLRVSGAWLTIATAGAPRSCSLASRVSCGWRCG